MGCVCLSLPRKDRPLPPAATDGVMAALRRPGPAQQAGALRGSPHVAWSHDIEEPHPRRRACGRPAWSADKEAKDGDSSVSSGPLSGSSGGHESCTPPHGPWRERGPRALGPPRRPRESSPRLELLRDKIRAQAWRQASCASLGTSTRSSTSRLYKAPTPAPRRKARKHTNPSPAPASAGSGILSEAESGIEDKAIPGQGCDPSRASQRLASVLQEKNKRMKSSSCKREKAPKPSTPRRPAKDTGHTKKVGVSESSPVRPRTPSPASVHSDPQVSANTPNLPSCRPPVDIQAAMAILRDLRQQIQVGLELARDRHPWRGLELRNLRGRRRQGPWSSPDVRGSFTKSPRATTGGIPTSERAGSLPTGQCWSTVARRESYPQRAWAAHGRDLSFQRPGSPTERLNSFPQRPWSVLARQASGLQRAWAAHGQDRSFQRPGSPHERLGPFPQRPWSASAGQASGPQRAWATCEGLEAPTRRPWNSLERLSPPTWRPWSTSFTQEASPLCRARGSLLPSSGAKLAWPRPSQGAVWNTPGKEKEGRPPPPCPKPRGPLGPPHSSESLREFMRQKTVAWRRQALEEKASAMRALELRNQRLQDIYRKQREAVLCKAVPVVSQTTPGIVTFVPHSAQSRGLEASESPGSPVLEWSKVTSGMVLGDQEAPGSFCLCLNRALNPAETRKSRGPRAGWEGAPLLMSARSSQGPLKLQDLTTPCPRPGLCIYLDPEESERLGMAGPLHFRYKEARLQALETMANILKQRIDILTDKLRRSEAVDTLGDAVLDPHPWSSSTPACPGALVANVGGGAPWDWTSTQARPLLSTTSFPDGETPSWSPGWEQQQQDVSPRGHHASRPRGFVEDGRLDLGKKLARNMAPFQALSPLAGSSRGAPAMPDPCCGSQRLEEMRSARGVGLVTPWTTRSCGLLSDIQQKSLSFLESLKLDQQKQEQALALLRRQAELEVWETQKALEELLFKHRLEQRLMEKHSTQARPEVALELERPQVHVDLELMTSQSTMTARPSSHLGGDAATVASPSPKRGQKTQGDESADAEPVQEGRPGQTPSQLPPARLYSWDVPILQWSRTGARSVVPGAFIRFTLQMLEQNMREEELRAQHQAALLSLREKALEEKMRAELAWLEHQRGYLGSTGSYAALVALAEKQHQALSNLEREQREIRYLRNTHLFSHQERKLLLQHQKNILALQMSTALLQQELQAQSRLPQNSSLEVKATWAEGAETSQQPGGPAQGSSCPPSPTTPHRSGIPASHRPWRSPEKPQVPHLLTEQQDSTAPQVALAGDGHLQPPRLAWGEDAPSASCWPDVGDRLGESRGLTGQEPEEQPHVPLPGLQQAASLGMGQPLDPAFPTQAGEAEGSFSAAQLQFQLVKEPPPGDPQTNPSPWSAEEETALMESHAPSSWDRSQHSPGAGSPRGPCEASVSRGLALYPLQAEGVAEGSRSPVGSESGLDFASSPVGEPHAMESWSREQRVETCWQEDPLGPFSWQEASQLTASPAAAAEAVAPPAQPEGSPLAQISDPLDLSSESEAAPRTCSGSSARSPTSPSGSSLSCPSLQEFQKASAILIQLSESSVSLSDWEAGDTRDADFGTSASEGGDFGRGRETGPLQVLAGHPEEPWGVDPSPSADRKPLEASPEPDPRSPQAPPGDPSGLAAPRAESQAPRFVGSRAPPALEEVCPPVAGGVLPEVLSPTDEVLSYGSATLPPSTHRDTCLPPLPPNVLAEREADPAHPHSEGFPSLPEDTWSPWGALGAPGEDASILTGELPSLSEEGLPAALSLGPQESGLCLGVAGQGRNCGDELGESSSIGGHQAMGGQWAEPVGWLGSPLCGGAGDTPVGLPRLSVQPPTLSSVGCVTGESLPTLLAAGDTGLYGSRLGHPAPTLGSGPCTDTPGMERAEVVDLVSTQLTRRILCDSLAVLSEPAPPGSLGTEEPAGASRVTQSHTAATGQSWGRRDS
ncbi:coiled-coil domain-containing protein 187 isoform X3 [Camelus bactrianus]|uniref:Coiled-coil domain-containing protein 187 isoform X3 n=1 Tax=Camelus bactrianus TaxID=9837 RepID=A0AC58Q8L4_CAMBA